jgi:VanZ like family
VLAVLGATLSPSGGAPQHISLCLLCGERGAADALRNLLLFAPLGVAIALCGWRGVGAVLAPMLLSLAVETAQIWIPGRDPSLGDVVFNTVGAAAGFAAIRVSVLWLRPAARSGRLLMLSALLGLVGVCGAAGFLLRPDLPASTYWGQWTPQLGHLEWYRGRIHSVTLGPLELPDGQLARSDMTRALLLARAPLVVHAVAGPPVPALGSLFSIADNWPREIMLLGPYRDDLIFRLRTRASAARLEQPDLRVTGMLSGIAPGDSLNVTVRANGNGYCVAVNGRESCGLGFTLGRGWGMLAFPEALSSRQRTLLDCVWTACLLLPLGFWLTGRTTGLLAMAAAAATLGLVPIAAGLMPTPPGEWMGAAAGLALGLALRRLAGVPPPTA